MASEALKPSPAELREIIERLEKLEGPEREVDDLVGAAAYGTEPIGAFSPGSRVDKRLPHYTASLDAAVALVEKMLPGWDWNAGSLAEDGVTARVWEHGWHDDTKVVCDCNSTPAIALLIALLRALEQKP